MPGSDHTLDAGSGSLSELMSSDAIGTWDWDIQANRLYIDDVLARLYGVDLDQAKTGLPFEQYAASIHPQDREWLLPYVANAIKQSGLWIAEYRTCPRDGDVRWVLARGQFYHDAAGRPIRSWGIMVDITNRKLDGHGFAGELTPRAGHPLEQLEHAADLCLSAREAILEAGRPFLVKLTDMLLLELGRELSRLARTDRRRRLN
ncbi:PAS domain-containing protein [Methylobacterium sp. ID0610]|uniref:PAS domain-containing protein n=1 Tax=Methylobacterium carpenticola TaxID=3344827 RepID=UPI0036A78A18